MPAIVNVNRGQGINTTLLSQAMMQAFQMGQQQQFRKNMTELQNAMQISAEQREEQRQLGAEQRAERRQLETEKRATARAPWKPKTKQEAIELKQAGQAPAYKIGTIKIFKKKVNGQVMDIPHEWTGQEWQPRTELSGPSFKPEGPEYKPGEALKLIMDVQRQRGNLDKDNTITQFIVALNPDLQGLLGQQAAPEVRQKIEASMDSLIQYLQQFIPQGFQQSPVNIPGGGELTTPKNKKKKKQDDPLGIR